MVWLVGIGAGLILAILLFLLKILIANYRLNNFTIVRENKVRIRRIDGITSFIEYFWDKPNGFEIVSKASLFGELFYLKRKVGLPGLEWQIYYRSIFSPKEMTYCKFDNSFVVSVEEIDYLKKKTLRYYLLSDRCTIKLKADVLYEKTKKKFQPIFEKASQQK